MQESPLQLVSAIGGQLGQLTRPNKDLLLRSLRQAASALSQMEPPSLHETSKKQEAAKNIEDATKPLRKSIIKNGLHKHGDKEVRLLVSICVSEVFRILAPEPPFEDKYLRDIFRLILSVFVELADATSPYFSKRVKILETVARCKCFVIMLDIDCPDLVLEMFKIFFSVVREHHQQSLFNDISSIMSDIVNEEASQSIIDVILQNLVKEGKNASAASNLAVSLIQQCEEKLEPSVCGFLTSCFLDGDVVQSELKESYHDITFKIFQCAPQMLLAVIPSLTQELQTDQVDVRIRAMNLTGKLLALPDHHVVQRYPNLFVEFLKRFSDKSAEVRVCALQCAKACYLANPSGTEAFEILNALEQRLLDFDDRVRMQAVIAASDITKSNMKFVPPKLISETSERLRDKKICVRKKALQKLIEVYRDYCNKCSEGHMTICDHFEHIPCKILMLCFDKDCKEFRYANMELVLAEELFPVHLSFEERTKHWIHLFYLFNPLHVKALNTILFQKHRFQTEMQLYLALRKEKEHSLEEMQKRIGISFTKMSSSFPDPSKTEECFHKLNQVRDNRIFNFLAGILDEKTFANAQTVRDKFLKMIGDKHPHLEFLRSLSSKCMCNIFSSEHVKCILDQLYTNSLGNKYIDASSIKLLLGVINIFPSFLRGSEEQFRRLLEKRDSLPDKLIEVFAKAGPHISVDFGDFYPFLERMCFVGSRAQAKYAVSAIASLSGSSQQFVFSELCKELVDSLHNGENLPTVLQSLGCISQHSVSAFETQNRDITSYIYEKIFKVESSDDLITDDEPLACSCSCKLKIYGLKMLVKSFLPYQRSQVTWKIDDLLDILSKMLEKNDAFSATKSSERDKAHIRLAAAKSVLKLSRRWNLHISSEVFCLTILMAKDTCSFVRRSFLDKTRKLLKERVIPSRYACVFAFSTSDCLKDLQDDSFKYMAEFIKDYSREAQIHQTSSEQGMAITDYPAYIVVFLIHVLAHSKDFPPEDCKDEQVYAQFCHPLFSMLQALVNTSIVNGDVDLVNDTVASLLCIFRAIKRADDAIDAQKTPKLHLLADMGISAVGALNQIGISSSRTRGLILLPSSLYRISLTKNSEEANLKCHTPLPFEQNFLGRIIDMFKYQISLPPSTLLKRKHQENKRPVIINTQLTATCKQDDVPISGANETHKDGPRKEISSRRSRRRVSPTDVGLVALPKKCSTVKKHVDIPSKLSEKNLEKQLSSGSSITLKVSPTDPEVVAQKLRKTTTCLNGIRASGSVTGEASKNSTAMFQEPCSSKDFCYKSEVMTGRRIKLLSPVDGCIYFGSVDSFNSRNNTHKIIYDNGDVELVCLDSESWEILNDGSLEREAISAKDSNSFSLQASLEETELTRASAGGRKPETLSKHETQKLCSRTFPLAGKAKKGLNVFGDTSVSELINIHEDGATRTRSRQTQLAS